MPKALLLNMKDFVIVGEYDSEAQAEDAGEGADYPRHVVTRDDWDLTATDIVKFYNKLPGVAIVKRFENRAVAMKRLLAVLNGETTNINERADDGDETNPETNNGDTSVSTKKKSAKKSTKKSTNKPSPKKAAGERSPRIAKDFVVEATAAGKKDDLRMNAESIRTKLLTQIKKADSTTVDALEKKFPDYTRTNIIGAVRYLAGKGYVRIS